MNKRLTVLFLALALIFALLPAAVLMASAESVSGACGSNLSWTLDTETGALEITGTGEMENWSDSDSNYAPWYSYRNSIETVTIGNGVTNVGAQAFCNCTWLTSVTVPDSVTSIGDEAFSGCTGLTSITIPDGVTSIGDFAFEGCSGLASVTIPDSMTSIGDAAFEGCDGLTGVYISDVASWCNIVFANGYANPLSGAHELYLGEERVTDLEIPAGVETLHNNVFSGCTGLTSVTIPDSVTSIGTAAFYHCTGLTSVTIGNGVMSIGGGAFADTGYYNEKANWTGKALYIGNYLIEMASDMAVNFVIREGTRALASEAFANCPALVAVYIPISMKAFSPYSFGTTSILQVFYGGTEKEWLAIEKSTENDIDLPLIHFNSAPEDLNVYSGPCGEDVIWTLDLATGELEITGTGEMTRRGWYRYRSSIKTVSIGSGVTSICDSAFSYCSGLTSVTIPDSVTSIGYMAFYKCTGLTSVTIPDSVTSIGYSAFEDCTSLKNVTIPDSVTSIGYSAFKGCTGLTYVTIPDGVTSIGIGEFYGCTGLTSVTIPNSVTSIGGDAFYGCTGLTSVTIPNSVTSIGANAFTATGYYDNPSNWTDGVLYIGDYLIDANTSLAGAYTVKAGTKLIAGGAFSGRTRLTSVTIPDSVTSIGRYAFDGCTGLTSVTIPNSVTSIGHDAFINTGYYNNESNWTDGILYIGNYLIKAKTTLTGAYTVKAGTKLIPSGAFTGCTGLTSVTIPDSVTSIGNGAFFYCYSLTSVTIPDSVTSIGNQAFYRCEGLTSVTIPDSVTSLGNSAFYGCAGLTSLIIGNGVTSIGSGAFENCTRLTRVRIGKGVRSIDSYAFSNCTALTSMTIPDGVTSIGDSAFAYCTGLTSVTIGNGVTSIGGRAFRGCTGLTSVTIGSGVTRIDYFAFLDCTGLTSITIPDNVTSIGSEAFSGCTGLTSVTIGSGVTSIGYTVFYNCTSLTSVTIPSTVRRINGLSLGYYRDSDIKYAKLDGFTIYGYKDSAAQFYAGLNGFAFVDLEDMPVCEHANTEVRDAKEATCTEDGYTGDTYCVDCGEKLASGEKIPALGHDFADGVCTRCGEKDPDYKPTEAETPGDLNGDGDVDTVDAIRLAKYLVGLAELTDEQVKAADVNGDGDVTALDGIRLAKFLVGLVETLRPEPAKAAPSAAAK